MRTLFLLLFVGIKSIYFSQTTITDVSGNIYKTVKIGNQIWMAENLRTEKFNNGDPIEQITSNRFWQEVSDFAYKNKLEEIRPVMSYYANEKEKNNALYNWYVVIDERGVCPSGYHIPSAEELNELVDYLGGIEKSSAKLKSATGWKTAGTNSSGFNALPIGYRVGSGDFEGKNEETGYWSDDFTEEINPYNDMKILLAVMLKVKSNNSETEIRNGFFNSAQSIRCIKN